MVDYHTIFDKETGRYSYKCKMGILDDWRYVRRSEAEHFVQFDSGSGVDIATALNSPAILWRFPWPDEDQDLLLYPDTAKIEQRDPKRAIEFKFPELQMDEHLTVYVNCEIGGKVESLENICPRIMPNIVVAPAYKIMGVRYDKYWGERTIFSCKYCDRPFSCNAEEIQLIVEILKGKQLIDYQLIVSRLRPKITDSPVNS